MVGALIVVRNIATERWQGRRAVHVLVVVGSSGDLHFWAGTFGRRRLRRQGCNYAGAIPAWSLRRLSTSRLGRLSARSDWNDGSFRASGDRCRLQRFILGLCDGALLGGGERLAREEEEEVREE